MTVNNILNLKITGVLDASSVNFGSTINIAPESIKRITGGAFPVGDCSRGLQPGFNLLVDPHLIDNNTNA